MRQMAILEMGTEQFEIVDEELRNQIKNSKITNVLEYGAKGDGITDDTESFNNAMNSGDLIFIPKTEKSYLLNYLFIPENKILIGIGNPKLDIHRKSTSIMSCIKSNSTMKNLYINSLDENLEWNRFEINNASNVLIEGCKFEGYRHTSGGPNAWGNYLNNASNIRIINCEYDNNSQSDIAIVDGNEDIVIRNCKGVNDIFHINFEPNGEIINKNIIVDNCKLSKLSLLENSFNVHPLDNITIQNCIIDLIDYRGANVNLINSKIKDIIPTSTYGGVINNINSIGFYKNINNDPTFKNFKASSESSNLDKFKNWINGYSPESSVIQLIEDIQKGRCIQLNPNNINTVLNIYKDFEVDGNSLYAIRTLMNTKTGETITYSGHCMKITYYDNENTKINNPIKVCLDRNSIKNNESEWSEKTLLLKTPENCVKLRISLSNTNEDVTSFCKATFKYLLLNKINLEGNIDELDLKTYSDDYNKTNIPMFGGLNQSLIGDKIYCKDIATTGCEGFVCIQSGNPGVWKKFGITSE